MKLSLSVFASSARRCGQHSPLRFPAAAHRVRRISGKAGQDRRAVRRRRFARRHCPGDCRAAQEGTEGALRGAEHSGRRRRQGHRRSQQGEGRWLHPPDGLDRRADGPAADLQAGLCHERFRAAGPACRSADRPRRQGGQPVQIGEGHRGGGQGQARRHQIRHAGAGRDPAHQHGDLRQGPGHQNEAYRRPRRQGRDHQDPVGRGRFRVRRRTELHRAWPRAASCG